MSDKRQVLRAASLVGGLTLLSRVTGLVRGAVLTAMFGDSRLHDIFLTSFEVANLPRRVLGEGALSSFIVPLLTERRAREGEASGWDFINRAANWLTLAAIVLTALMAFFSRQVFWLVGGSGLVARGEVAGLADGARLTALMSPFIIGLTLAAVLMGACHTLRRFTAASLGSVMMNAMMIGAGLLALHQHREPEVAARWIAWAVLAGVALRVVIMIPPLRAAGWRWRPDFKRGDPEVGRLLHTMGPGLTALAVNQVNLAVASFFAMYLAPGVKSHIAYAVLLVQFPMALTANAAATALLPQLPILLQPGRESALRDLLGTVKRLEIVLMMPAMTGLIALGLPIVALLFQHHAWTANASRETYLAVIFYAPGLLPLGWMRLLEPIFFARHDRTTPLRAACGGLGLNIALNVLFAFGFHWDQAGLALANTIAAYFNYWLLSRALERQIPGAFGETAHLKEALLKSIACAAPICLAGAGVYFGLANLLGGADGADGSVGLGFKMRALILLPTMMGIAVVYFAAVKWVRLEGADAAIGALRRKLGV